MSAPGSQNRVRIRKKRRRTRNQTNPFTHWNKVRTYYCFGKTSKCYQSLQLPENQESLQKLHYQKAKNSNKPANS